MTMPRPTPSTRPRSGSRGRHPSILAALAAGSVLTGLLALGGPPAAAVERPGPLAGVPAFRFGDSAPVAPAAADSDVSFYVGLRRPEKAARAALRRVSTPGGERYRDFPTRSAVAADYGVSAPDLAVLRRVASTAGVRVHLDRTGVFARISGRPAAIRRFFGTKVRVSSPAAGVAKYQLGRTPTYAASLRPIITETISASMTWDTSAPQSVRTAAPTADPVVREEPLRPAPTNQGTYVRGCALDPLLQPYTYSFAQLTAAYGTDTLRRRADREAPRMAIISLGDGFSDEMLQLSAECFGLAGSRFIRVPVHGLTGPLPELQGEADLDTQMAQAILPSGSRVHVVESGPLPATWFVAFARAFALPRRPDVVSVSYGVCETFASSRSFLKANPTQWLSLHESVLLRLGLAGVTVTASSGDDGSSDCVEITNGADTRRAVDYPGASPNVLAVGGTRIVLDAANRRADEVAWNDSMFSIDGRALSGSGGGGTSVLFDRPWWQPRAVTGTRQRAVPDVSLHASTTPGWPVAVTPTTAGTPAIQPWGGTSASTPYVAANLAMMAALERAAGRSSFGLVGSSLFALHGNGHRAFYRDAAFDVTEGDNDEYGVGCCSAARGFDLATGLGVPRFETLLAQVRGL